MQTHYFTIKKPSTGEYREKGSKFLAYAYPVDSEDDIREHIEHLKKEHPKSRHVCYAYRLDTEKQNFRANDDGEPSGTAGKPILGQIDSKDLSKIFIAVVRYFGGKKLGASGLIHAYKTSAADALENTSIIKVDFRERIELYYPMEQMNDVMRFLKHPSVKIEDQQFDNMLRLTFSVNLEAVEGILNQISKIYQVQVKQLGKV